MPSAARRLTGLSAGATRLSSGQDTRRSGDMFVAAIASGATAVGVDVHVAGRPADSRARVPRRPGRVRRRDHGVRLPQPGGGQRPEGARRTRAEARRRRRGRARGADLPRGGAAGRRERGTRAGRGRRRAARSLPRPTGWGSRRPSGRTHADRRRLRERIGRRRRLPRSSPQQAPTVVSHPQRSRRGEHQRRLRRDGPGVPCGDGSSPRGPTSGSRSTATPTG